MVAAYLPRTADRYVASRPASDLAERAHTLHRIAETRLATLKVRADAAGNLAAAKAAQEEIRKKQQALTAERQELEQRLQSVGVSIYSSN